MRLGEYRRGMTATAVPSPEAQLQAFAEPTRLRLMALLLDGETCVCDLTAALEIPQPTASRHLAHLRRAGLVRVRKSGLWAWYSLAPASGPVHEHLLACLGACRAEIPELDRHRERCQRSRAGRNCC